MDQEVDDSARDELRAEATNAVTIAVISRVILIFACAYGVFGIESCFQRQIDRLWVTRRWIMNKTEASTFYSRPECSFDAHQSSKWLHWDAYDMIAKQPRDVNIDF